MSKSTVFYRHNKEETKKDNNNNKILLKEKIIDGEKGITFDLLYKNFNDFLRIKGKQINDKTFELYMKKKDKEKTSEISISDLDKLISKEYPEYLQFLKNYMDTKKKLTKTKNMSGGALKKSTKKSTKKATKKPTKKSTKKPTKKVTKKTTKKLY